jgi:tripartite-type tricarboxylate transporter receptor subunit TctC
VAYNPGGAADVAARLVAAHASKKWGQPVSVVNMPGASGITGALRALNAGRTVHAAARSACDERDALRGGE